MNSSFILKKTISDLEEKQRNEIETLKKEFEQTLEVNIADLKKELENNHHQLLLVVSQHHRR